MDFDQKKKRFMVDFNVNVENQGSLLLAEFTQDLLEGNEIIPISAKLAGAQLR